MKSKRILAMVLCLLTLSSGKTNSYNVHYLKTNNVDLTNQEDVYVLNEQSEFNDYFEQNKKYFSDLLSFKDTYNEKYFSHNYLIIIKKLSYSSSLEYSLDKLINDEQTLTIDFSISSNPYANCDLVMWNFIIEISKTNTFNELEINYHK